VAEQKRTSPGYMARYAMQHPDRIVPHARRRMRNAWLLLLSRGDHVRFYSEVMRRDPSVSAELEVGTDSHRRWLALGRKQFEYLLEHGLQPQHRMLDIGCGTLRAGRLFIDYLDTGNYYGIDISPEILFAAQQTVMEYGLQGKLPHLTLVRDNRFAFLPDNYFDVVHAHRVFSHSPVEVIEQCLAHVERIMKPDGFFDFTFDRTTAPDHRVAHDTFYYRTETLVALANRHGLDARCLDDWEERLHQQARIRVTARPGRRRPGP
jgi:ubiquinone/menaquinone biosynthesis C-methylase UbiE